MSFPRPGPLPGDRILVLRPHWLNLILDDEKDLEIRGRNLASGPYWLGCRGTIYGHCFLGSSILIDSAEAWRGLRFRHRVEADELLCDLQADAVLGFLGAAADVGGEDDVVEGAKR